VHRRKTLLPTFPTALGPVPMKIRGKNAVFSVEANWAFIKQSKNTVFISREPAKLYFHVALSKLFIPHQDNMIGYFCIAPGFLESSKKIQP